MHLQPLAASEALEMHSMAARVAQAWILSQAEVMPQLAVCLVAMQHEFRIQSVAEAEKSRLTGGGA